MYAADNRQQAGSERPTSVPFSSKGRPQHGLQLDGRLDGRSYEEFRAVFMQTGVLSQAAGSAYVEFQSTKLMVGVYGPRQIDRKTKFSEQGRLQCDIKLLPFATLQRGKAGQSSLEREYSAQMQTALSASVDLSAFPKASLDVYCTILESGGSDIAVAITAGSLAMADAGIEMLDLAPACMVSLVQGKLLLDPASDESAREDGSVMVALLPSHDLVSQVVMSGDLPGPTLDAALELAMGGCHQLAAAMRECLIEAAAR